MTTLIDNIFISNLEYNTYIVNLTTEEKFRYLIDRINTEISGENLKAFSLEEFFEELKEESGISNEVDLYEIRESNPGKNKNQVDVMIDEENILIESNSLKNIRIVIRNFFELGYILRRDQVIEKMFKENKTTRYLRVYTIINQIGFASLN
jgi:hypothetical protein